jgi:hypothetical protein
VNLALQSLVQLANKVSVELLESKDQLADKVKKEPKDWKVFLDLQDQQAQVERATEEQPEPQDQQDQVDQADRVE